MGPVVWWWRWWLGMDPNRESQLTEERGPLEEQRSQTDDLSEELHARDVEIEKLRDEVRTLDGGRQAEETLRADLDQARADAQRLTAELERSRAEAAELHAHVSELEAGRQARDTTPTDVSQAAAILGSAIATDDLTVVDGIGPKIAGLLGDAGFNTWRALADADVEQLEKVLADAGPRYRMHDPSTWPEQAVLLADGRWQEFKDFARD